MNFSNTALSQPMIDNLTQLGFKAMTPIQEKAIPLALQNHDLIAKAKTGSGKTAAFGIPIIEKLDVKKYAVQTLILCPTRELAEQVTKEIRRFAKAYHNIKVLMLVGGASFGFQQRSLSHQAHIIVGTPGRVLKHMKKGNLTLDHVQTLVLDEADRMLDMGFYDEISEVVGFIPKERQTLLFSATFSDEIMEVTREFTHKADKVEIEERANKIDEKFYLCRSDDKFDTLCNIFATYPISNALIFCQTKEGTSKLSDMLETQGIMALAINGDMEQIDRTETLLRFANGSCNLLVATDVAARGLDIKELDAVINYDLPRTHDIYTHRIGRTGRADAAGMAFTFTTPHTDLFPNITLEETAHLNTANPYQLTPTHQTICIYGGRKDKLRAGDILGALTKEGGIDGKSIGKIDINDKYSYVAIANDTVKQTLDYLKKGKIKNKYFDTVLL
jgi:ATP-independent RNA helicase DbpA